jgi:hypothetical protein
MTSTYAETTPSLNLTDELPGIMQYVVFERFDDAATPFCMLRYNRVGGGFSDVMTLTIDHMDMLRPLVQTLRGEKPEAAITSGFDDILRIITDDKMICLGSLMLSDGLKIHTHRTYEEGQWAIRIGVHVKPDPTAEQETMGMLSFDEASAHHVADVIERSL